MQRLVHDLRGRSNSDCTRLDGPSSDDRAWWTYYRMLGRARLLLWMTQMKAPVLGGLLHRSRIPPARSPPVCPRMSAMGFTCRGWIDHLAKTLFEEYRRLGLTSIGFGSPPVRCTRCTGQVRRAPRCCEALRLFERIRHLVALALEDVRPVRGYPKNVMVATKRPRLLEVATQIATVGRCP